MTTPKATAAHPLGEAAGSELVREADIQRAVNASCECGGRGPEDDCCAACEVWHRLHGRQIKWERNLINAPNGKLTDAVKENYNAK